MQSKTNLYFNREVSICTSSQTEYFWPVGSQSLFTNRGIFEKSVYECKKKSWMSSRSTKSSFRKTQIFEYRNSALLGYHTEKSDCYNWYLHFFRFIRLFVSFGSVWFRSVWFVSFGSVSFRFAKNSKPRNKRANRLENVSWQNKIWKGK